MLFVTLFLLLSINESFCFDFPYFLSFVGGMNEKLSRRSFGNNFLLAGSVTSSFLIQHEPANAVWFEANDRRQLELCAVNVLRVLYWAEIESLHLEQAAIAGSDDKRKELYLESRLSAKALVTGKAGGGSTNGMYKLASLKLRDCLDDLVFYSRSSRVLSGLREDLIESLASLVEFDGLDTTQDPSPRSTLMLNMYNRDKEAFVRRMLKERIIPTAVAIVGSFDSDVRTRCDAYIVDTYPNEVPKKPDPTVTFESSNIPVPSSQ